MKNKRGLVAPEQKERLSMRGLISSRRTKGEIVSTPLEREGVLCDVSQDEILMQERRDNEIKACHHL